MFNRYYQYPSLGINNFDRGSTSFLVIIWGLYAGILLGVLYSLVMRVNSHKVVKALTEHGASTKSTAKTLAELGLANNRVAKRLLAGGSSMRRVVLCANESDFPPRQLTGLRKFWREIFLRDPLPPETDFTIARFYLPEEKRAAAEARYTVEGHPVRNFILAAVGLTAAALFTMFALPELLKLVDNFAAQVAPQSKYY